MQNFSPLQKLVHDQARIYGRRVALRYRDYEKGVWKDISWKQFSDQVRRLANAMVALGVGEQENIGVLSQNKPEGLIVDFASYAIRAVVVPMYATSSEMQVKYIVSDANIRYVFVGEQEQYDIAFRVLQHGSTLEKLIIFSRNVQRNPEDQISEYFDDFISASENNFQGIVRLRSDSVQPDDLANILYTSGTTGLSKGVMLTHEMLNTAVSSHYGVFPLSDRDVVLNFLPFTHVLERGWAYLCIANGCTLAINSNPADVLQSMREVHPTCMCAVPRFWEKVYSAVQERIERSNPMQKKLLQDALRIGHEYNVEYRMKKVEPPLALRLQYSLYEGTMIAFLKKQLGLERANFFPTAGAAVPPVIEDFVRSV
jgi:long-chain acyl-CoA synthetase